MIMYIYREKPMHPKLEFNPIRYKYNVGNSLYEL